MWNATITRYCDDCRDEPDSRTLSVRRSRSRVERACDYCRKPIRAGTLYERHAYLLDGVFTCDRVHSMGGHCIGDD